MPPASGITKRFWSSRQSIARQQINRQNGNVASYR
jgi:hypothetical protein